MIGIIVPGVPGKIQSTVIKLIILDILYPENWLPDAIKETLNVNIEEEIEDDEAVNLQF
jgi:hypothetical protein